MSSAPTIIFDLNHIHLYFMIFPYSSERTHGKQPSARSTSHHLLDLPVELLIEILKYLHFTDILRCQAVSPICSALLALQADLRVPISRHVGLSVAAGCYP